MKTMAESTIRTVPKSECYLCGGKGIIKYHHLQDSLFGAPGAWQMRQCVSPGCGLMWLDPMPTKADIGQAYVNYYTHTDRALNDPSRWSRFIRKARSVYLTVREDHLARRYGYQLRRLSSWKRWLARVAPLPFLRAQMDFSVMYLPAVANGRLLEVGCGNGEMLRNMQALGWSVHGVDFDEAAVARAREKGLDVSHGDLHSQAYADNYFDAIVMSHVIEHVHDPRAVLQECYRILKPGGRLVMVTPNTDSWGHRLFGRHWRGLEPPRHLHIFNIEALRHLLRQTRFVRCNVVSTLRDANSMLATSIMLKRRKVGTVNQTSLPVSVIAKILQAMEYMAFRLGKQPGEELAGIGCKPIDGRPKSISVALCTYNGERFLAEQLDSIRAQTVLPDELVVCDDGSTDATLAILTKFAASAPFRVHVIKNEKRLGSTKNFEKAIKRCSGDIIALCDQDDVWSRYKIERMIEPLTDGCSAVFTDAEVVDDRLHSLGYSLWRSVHFTTGLRSDFRNGKALQTLLKYNFVTGATLAFRRDCLELFTPIPESWVHDGWIALSLAASNKRMAFIEEPLIKYRQHANNQLGARRLPLGQKWNQIRRTDAQAYFVSAQRQYTEAYERLSARGVLGREHRQQFKSKLYHLARRQALSRRGVIVRSFIILAELLAGRYARYSNGWRSAARDFAF